MATEQEIRDICGLYVAYFNRAADPEGLEFWVNQLDNGRDFATISQDFATSTEALEIYPFLADPTSVSSEAFVTAIYANLFGRAPDAAGLSFWVGVLDAGDVAPGDMVEAIMLGAQDATVAGGEVIRDLTTIENKIDAAKFWTDGVNEIEGFVFDDAAYDAAQAAIAGVTDDAQTVADAIEVSSLYLFTFEPTNNFTLWQNTVEISPAVEAELVTETVTYWGFNPNSNDETGVDNTAEPNTNNLSNENIEDGGIPLDDFFGEYLPLLMGNTVDHINELIDVDNADNQIVDFSDLEGLRDITIGDANTLTFHYADGASDDVVIIQEYFDFLCKIIFDNEGNSRLFEREVAVQVPLIFVPDESGAPGEGEYVIDPTASEGDDNFVAFVDLEVGASAAVTAPVPVILTPTQQNGSTVEPNARTTDENDTIVAGNLDMLHQAVIDGGDGINTLEVDVKGQFAQPKSLINIQYINVENLPNVYSTGTEVGANQAPDVVEDGDANADPDSVLDLSRATDLINVTITEGAYDFIGDDFGDDQAENPIAGDLLVAGLRNNATLTLQGNFADGDVFVLTSEGFTGNGFTVNLDNVNAESTMYIADNSPTLNLVSRGGGNYFADLDEFNNGAVNTLNISGSAKLQIESNLAAILEADTPIVIDATQNTAGVNLLTSNVDELTFLGTNADDIFRAATDDSDLDAGILNDTNINVVTGSGNDRYELATYTLNVTAGEGNNDIEAIANVMDITAGDGDNVFEVGAAYGKIDAGDGNNRVDLVMGDSLNTIWPNRDDVPTDFTIDLGDGSNKITFGPGAVNTTSSGDSLFDFISLGTENFGLADDIDGEVTINAGDGGNYVVGTAATINVTTGNGDDEIDVSGQEVTIRSNGGDDKIGIVGFDDDYVTQVQRVESGATVSTANVVTFTPDAVDEGGLGGLLSDNIEIFYTVDGEFRSVLVTDIEFDATDVDSIGQAVADALNTPLRSGGDVSATWDSSTEILTVVGEEDSFGVAANVVIQGITPVGTDIDGLGGNFVSAPIADGNYGDGFFDDGSFNYLGFVPSVYGVDIDIDTGSGSADIYLGRWTSEDSTDSGNADNSGPGNGSIVAKTGSIIQGNDITLFVDTHADLRAASLNDITRIVMDDDNAQFSGQGFPVGSTSTDLAASLTLLDTQVTQLINEGTEFVTQGQFFGAQSVLTIVITDDTVLSDLIDFNSWNTSIKLAFVVEDGASLELTAQELDLYVMPAGIAVDEANNRIINPVTVTEAGFDFDAFNDQYGGTGGGTISGSIANEDINIIRSAEGYTRPVEGTSTDTISINSDQTPVVDFNIESDFSNDLVITGSADLTLNGYVDLADDFTIDFSNFNGDFTTTNADGVEIAMTIYNFQELTGDVNSPVGQQIVNNGVDEGIINPYSWGRIDGNGTTDDPVRINVVMQDGTSVGDCDQGVAKGGFNSSGVQQFVLTGFINENGYIEPQSGSFEADIVVCDHTEDLEVLGLQNNRNSTVTFHQVDWGTTILMEGDGYANASDQEKNLGDPDFSEVGHVVANFFEPGANAYVRITNQGTELGLNEDAEDGFDPNGERKLEVGSIVVNNADRLLIAVEDGDAIIKDVTGIDVERVIVTGPEDVELRIDCIDDIDGSADDKGDIVGFKDDGFDSKDLVSIDGSGVVGEFKLTFDGSGTGDELSDGGDPGMTLLDAWGNPVLDTKVIDLSGVALIAVDAIELAGDNIQLIMTAEQLATYGPLITTTGDNSRLDVIGLGDEALDLQSFDVDFIGTVVLAEGIYTLDASVDFDGVQQVVLNALDEDTNVTMTIDQFQSIDGTAMASIDGEMIEVSAPKICFDEDDGDATLTLTGVEGDDQIFTGNIVPATGSSDVLTLKITGSDFVGTEDFAILPDDDADVFVEVCLTGGINDVTDVPISQLLGLDCLVLDGGAVLNITADQLEVLMSQDPQEIKVADGGTATINVIDLDGSNVLDLSQLVADNPGLTIGDVFIENTDEVLIVNAGTTFGGGNIITPTADLSVPEFGTEQTNTLITLDQFFTSSGSITGDGMINITDVYNNSDSDGDFVPDVLLADFTGITAPKGQLWLREEFADSTTDPMAQVTETGETVTLDVASDISGFAIRLTDGQLFAFATEAQAAAEVFELLTVTGNPTGIVWLFDTVSGPVDTSEYSSDINTLFVPEQLVDGANEEDLWTTLASTIVVEKYNDAAPRGLVVFNRINTFEAFGAAIGGITFDDTEEFSTVGSLTLNLEGNVDVGGVTIAESNGDAAFTGLTVNSYLDVENLPDNLTNLSDPDGLIDNLLAQNIIVQPNNVGDITMNAGVAADTVVTVTLNTAETQSDAPIANGTTGAGSGTDLDAGQPLVVGTIFFPTPAAGTNSAVIDVNGAYDVTIGGIDMTPATLTLVNVNLNGGTALAGAGVDLVIGGVNYGDLAEQMGVTAADDLADLNNIFFLDGFVAGATDDLGAPGGQPENILVIVGGDNDLTGMAGSPGFGVSTNSGVYATGAGTITMTADQIAALGTPDGNGDNVADNWVLGPGVAPGSVTVNVTGLTSQLIDLDEIAAAGFNIGTITVDEPGADLDNGTTLGNADQIVLNIVDDDVTLELTAAQYDGLADGTIVENRGPNAEDDDVGTVVIDEVSAFENALTGEVSIDVSNVDTSGPNTFWLTDAFDQTPPGGADNDTTFSAASILDGVQGGFAVNLVDVNTDVGVSNELAGQTVRFSTETQANARVVTVTGADADNANSNSATNAGATEAEKDEKDTNVVWLFDAVSGGLDVSGYSGHIGRIWVSDELVDSVGGDIDGLFTIPDPDNPGQPLFTLDADIIKRIETEDLTALFELNDNIAQRVEITSFTTINGAEFEIDDPLVSVGSLRIDMGGATNINDLEIDNILGPVNPDNINFPGDDDFTELLINSLIANDPDHYLLPDSWTDAIPLPSNDLQVINQANTVGDISSGEDRGVLHTITINTFDRDNTENTAADIDMDEGPDAFTDDDAPGNGAGDGDNNGVTNAVDDGTAGDAGLPSVEGASFVANEIFFSDDGDTTAQGGTLGTPTATLNLTGENDVIVKSLDTSDADITALVVDTTGYTGTFTITGGSPAFDLDDVDDTTTTLTLQNGDAAVGVITAASSFVDNNDVPTATLLDDDVVYTTGQGEAAPWAGVSGGALTTINTFDHGGTISLGVISQVNGDEFFLNNSNSDGAGFGGSIEDGVGVVFACLGQALDDGTLETPTLNDGGVWTFDGDDPGDNLFLEMKAVNLGAGTLNLEDVNVIITGDIDFTDLLELNVDGDTTFFVAEGATLRLTVEQVDDLDAANGGDDVSLFGPGTVVVTGESDDSDGGLNTDFDVIGTGTMDLSAVTLSADDTNGAVDINVQGARDIDGTDDGTRLLDENGDPVAQTVIGTAFNDLVTFTGASNDGDGATLDVILQLGEDAGDIGDPLDTPEGDPDPAEVVGDVIDQSSDDFGGRLQINVDAGFDQVDFLNSFGAGTDEIVVSAGAEFYTGGIFGDFTPTTITNNDGIAVVETDGSANEDIDVSEAGGANGIILIGEEDSDNSGDSNELIGSNQNDTIVDGLADTANNAGEEDEFTGNDGDDLFIFNFASSSPADLTPTVDTDAFDEDEITIGDDETTDSGDEFLIVNYRFGNVITSVTVDDPAVNFESAADIATALAAELDALAGINASAAAEVVTVSDTNGEGFEFLGAVVGGTTDDLAAGDITDTSPNANDVAGIVEVEVVFNDPGQTVAAADEVYNLTVELANGTDIIASITAAGGETAAAIAAALVADFNTKAPATTVDAASAGTTITLTDEDADDGGFTVTTANGSASVSASSASSALVGAGDYDSADADEITDFVSGEDTLTFGLAAGSNSNYDEEARVADFATAETNANAAFAGDPDLIYFLSGSDADDIGLLFVNLDGDATADTVVGLVGIDNTSFDEDDIV